MEDGGQGAVDHGGGIDRARRRYGGARADWMDLSTGINPEPYPVQGLSADDWQALPDQDAHDALAAAAREFWQIPDSAYVLPVPGLSSAIAILPQVLTSRSYSLTEPTYNEYGRSFAAAGWRAGPDLRIAVHPNNPDGRLFAAGNGAVETVIDESFCDTMPDMSLIHRATEPGTLILKSFGKFWGLAGLRLGFVIGDGVLIARLERLLGPWAVSGPALALGARALRDQAWADETRKRLVGDAERLDQMFAKTGVRLIGGTPLFRLYEAEDAQARHEALARQHILTRVFPYAPTWLRVGLPPTKAWARLERAL